MGSLRRAYITVDRLVKSTVLARQDTPIWRVVPGYAYGGIHRFYSDNHGVTESLGIDFSDKESKRRVYNRLIYRSKQRGFLELDLILGKWVEDNIYSMDESGVKALSFFLDLENPDLWKWVTGQDKPPDAVQANPVFKAVSKQVMSNLNAHSSPETRALPGQPWVRGWDDIKRGSDSPVMGNQ